MIMQSNMTMNTSHMTERWKLHGNISQNGYGNAIIDRYGGCFEEGIWWVECTDVSCVVLEKLARVEG